MEKACKRVFKFKQFSLRHELAAMKIGVDGVLLGAWANLSGAQSILDVGCGCGLIAVMAAQRNELAMIRGIDIDEDAVKEAIDNASHTSWSERLDFQCESFEKIVAKDVRYDVVVSNPPFYKAGIGDPHTNRLISRHAASLSPEVLLAGASTLLTEKGVLAMITPADQLSLLLEKADCCGMKPLRITEVSTVDGKPPKRLLSEWTRWRSNGVKCHYSRLAIETGSKDQRRFTDDYHTLCAPFYLNF